MDTYDASMLIERAKELECMFAAEEILQNKNTTFPATMQRLVTTVPIGFSDSKACRVQIKLRRNIFFSSGFLSSKGFASYADY